MYRVHKREEKELAEETRLEDKYKHLTDGTENGSSIMNGTTILGDSSGSPVMPGRLGSIRRPSAVRGSISGGIANAGFVPEDSEKVIHETMEIVKDLPVLHVEHCKL